MPNNEFLTQLNNRNGTGSDNELDTKPEICIVGTEQDEVVSDQYSELGTEPESELDNELDGTACKPILNSYP